MKVLQGYEEIKSCVLCDKGEFTQLTRADQVNFYQCKNCLVTFLNPQPKFETLKEQYNARGLLEEGPVSAWFKHNKYDLKKMFQERLNDVSRYVARGDLLDVGCGMVDFCRVAREAGFNVFGTELSGDYAENTKKTVGMTEIFIGRLHEIAFSDRKFDVITLWHVLEHLPDPLDVLTCIRNILKKGGVVVVEVPNVEKRKKRPMYLSDIEDYPVNRLEHLFYYSGESLKRACTRVGFKVLTLNYVDAHQPAKNVIKHLLRKVKRPGKRLLYYGKENRGFSAFRIYLTI